ncbi:MAG TPA: YjgN family protein [Dongiaceae bacterium]
MNDKGGIVAAASWPGAGQPVQKLEYDGTIGALYWIFIKNLLLNIITLTIYRFWGKTNLRRYAWSHTALQGERFEYTGRGGELFLGFLVVVGFYAVGFIVFMAAMLAFGTGSEVIGKLAVGVLIIYFIFVAQYAAQNYRLTRTLWCGIQGGMTGSAWRYGLKAFLLTLLNIVTLNLATPWVTLRLAEERFNNSYLGNAKASLQASAKPLYLSFILGFVFSILGLVLLLLVLGGVGYLIIVANDLLPVLQELQRSTETGTPSDLTDQQKIEVGVFVIAMVIMFYFGLALVAIAAFAPYMAALFRVIANNLQLAELRFASEVTAWRYIRLWVGNLLWVVLTFGLGFPVAVHRSIRFFADRVTIHGELDVGRLQQTTLDRPKFGEGLLEAFDPGFF